MHDTLDEALAVLPFTLEEAVHLLGPVADTADALPPFTLSAGCDPSMVFLTPMYPALRSLTTRKAVRAWVLADMLCLDAAARRIEDDLVQRYAENPSAEGNWRAAFTLDGCPASVTLWERVSEKFGAWHTRWEFVHSSRGELPNQFGKVHTTEQTSDWASKQLAACVALLQRITTTQQGVTGGIVAPLLVATLQGHIDDGVARAAYEALRSLGAPYAYIEGYSAALSRFIHDADVRKVAYDAIDSHDHDSEAIATFLRCGTFRTLTRILTMHADDADELELICPGISNLAGSKLCARALVEEGALIPLIAALTRHATSATCLLALCSALTIILGHDGVTDGACSSAVTSGLIPPLMAQLKRIAALDPGAATRIESSFFSRALGLLATVAGVHSEHLQTMVDSGIIPLLANSMKNADRKRSFHYRSHTHLLSLLTHHPASTALLGPAGFIPDLLRVLIDSHDSSCPWMEQDDVVLHSCCALYHLALIPSNRAQMALLTGGVDGLRTLTTLLASANSGGGAVQWACRTLALLATDDAICAAIVASNGVPAILNVLCIHAEDSEAVAAACDALRVMAPASSATARAALAASLGTALAIMAPPASPPSAIGGVEGEVGAALAAPAGDGAEVGGPQC